MLGCVYNTDPRWIEFLRAHNVKNDVNFWRKDRRRLNLEVGAPFYFKQLGAALIVGRGIFREIRNMTAAEAWDRFDTRNGYGSRAEFFASAPDILDLTAVDGNTVLACIVLDQVEWLPTAVPLPAGFFPQGIMGAKFFELSELQFLDDAFSSDASEPELPPLVLVENEATLGGAYDHWEDRTGEVYHFPNQYRGRIVEGRRFVYYRGVRRENRRRGPAEYFGVGRVGVTWRDRSQPSATPKARRRWYCAIEDYIPFSTPVAASQQGRYFETISNARDWGIGVRLITEDVYREILALSGTQGPSSGIPTSIDDARLQLVDQLLKLKPSGQPRSGPPALPSSRRSRRAAAIGRVAEELVFRRLIDLYGEDRVRWHARDGELLGFDLSYEDSGIHAVEVKGTVGGVFPSVELTINEWNKAQEMRERFWLYLVADCDTQQPKLQIIRDPYAAFEAGSATVSPVIVRFELRSAASGSDQPAL
jgi:hypothetical protein